MDSTLSSHSQKGFAHNGSFIFFTVYWLTIAIVICSLYFFVFSRSGLSWETLGRLTPRQEKDVFILGAWFVLFFGIAISFFCKITIFASKLQQSLSRVDDKDHSTDKKNWSTYALQKLKKQQEHQLYMGCCWFLGFGGFLMRSMWEIGIIFILFIQFFGFQSPKYRSWLKANSYGISGLIIALVFSILSQYSAAFFPKALFQPLVISKNHEKQAEKSFDAFQKEINESHHLAPASYTTHESNGADLHSVNSNTSTDSTQSKVNRTPNNLNFTTGISALNTKARSRILTLCVIAIFICNWCWIIQIKIRQKTSLAAAEKKIQEFKEDKERFKKRAHRLCQYLSPRVWKFISLDQDKKLLTERKQLTVFFSDIKGFTSLSEELEAEILTELLNDYLTEMSKIVTRFGGSVNKFMGDGLMVIFGDHQSQGAKQDCINCTAMALSMRKQMKSLQYKWYNQGIKKPLEIRMGINSGFCTIGTFGARAHHLDYTALGTHVNLASRLETAASPGEILLSREAWLLVQDTVMCASKGTIDAKGFSHPVEVYQVVDFRKNLGAHQSFFSSSKQGFSIHLDLEKIRNYDQKKITEELEKALDTLKKKIIL